MDRPWAPVRANADVGGGHSFVRQSTTLCTRATGRDK
jgi:hypothetical protein